MTTTEPTPQPNDAANAGADTSTSSTNANDRTSNRPTIRIQLTSANRNGGPSVTVQNAPNSHQPQNVRRIAMPPIMPPPPLPPLEPQPVPHSRNHDKNYDNNNDPSLKKFECPICFEYLNTPVGCGSTSCPNRFCKKCLERVILQDIHRQSSSSANNNSQQQQQQQPRPKCPHCRTVIQPSSIRLDHSLLSEMNACTTLIPCPYEGCNEQLPLKELALHEKTCPHLQLKCRYEPFGCAWTGKSSDLSHHEANECQFVKEYSGIINILRKTHWETKHVINQHHGFMGLNHALIHSNRQLIEQRYNNCAGNVMYIVQMAWEATCFPDRFVMNGGAWSTAVDLELGMVCNQVYMWPFFGVILRVALAGMHHFVRLVQVLLDGDNNREVMNDELMLWDLFDTICIALAIAIVGVLIVMCFYIDVKSPVVWTYYNITSLIGPQPMIQSIAAACIVILTFGWMDFFGTIRGFFLWSLVSTLSLGYTSFFSGMIQTLNRSITTPIHEMARNRCIVIFGLRYGLLIYVCDFIPTIGAMLVFHLVPSSMRYKMHAIFDPTTECFFSDIQSSHSVVAIGAYLATTASMNQGVIVQAVIRVAVACIFMVCANVYIYLLQKAGGKLAALNSFKGNENSNNTSTIPAAGASITIQRPSPVGLCVAAAFVFSSMLIATI